jgi:hypothetical protein
MAPTRAPEQRRTGEHARDRRELRNFVGDGPVEQPIGLGQDRERRQRHAQCIAVGLGARGLRVADRSAGAAGAIFDDDRLSQDPFQGRRHRPRRKIALAAGRKRHDYRDVSGRVASLRERRVGKQGFRARQRGGSPQAFTAAHRQLPPLCFYHDDFSSHASYHAASR